MTSKDTFVVRFDNTPIWTINCSSLCGKNTWKEYSINVTGTGYDTLAFNWQTKAQRAPSLDAYGVDASTQYDMFALDDVSLKGMAAPEPSAWALMLVGFGGLGAALRSRRRTALANA